MAMSTAITLFTATLAIAPPMQTTVYDQAADRWLFDPAAIVSRNDVLYTTSSPKPWEAMPTGGGDLSAMVRFDGDLHLHLSKSDAWGYRAPAEAPPYTRYFNNVSPGHLRLDFGKRAKNEAGKFFRQRLDLYHGRVVITLGREDGARMEIWGHPSRKILIVEVNDPDSVLDLLAVELSQWRPTMQVSGEGSSIHAKEVLERPARPHLANAGMQDFFPEDKDPMAGRGIAVSVTSPSFEALDCQAEGQTARITLPAKQPAHYYMIIAAAVTASGDPLPMAQAELADAAALPLKMLKAEHQAWWRDYWGRSFLRVESPDHKASWLCAAYHVHLYTLGCVNRGPFPAKWNGGAGLMRRDDRSWAGLAEWVQEIRFTYMPLYAANRLEMARGLTRHYSKMVPFLQEQTRVMWSLPGLWIPETVLPWGQVEDLVLKYPGEILGDNDRWDPKTAPYGNFETFNPYVTFLFTAGLEICEHYLAYYRYSGDEVFLRQHAYPVLRGVCEFLCGLLRRGGDGRYHLDPANALETWWLVRDPSDTLDGIRAIFPQFARLAGRYKQDHELRDRCEQILAALPDPPLGFWTEESEIRPDVKVYAPAVSLGKFSKRINYENPALYRVYPFGLSHVGSDDYDLARETFKHRIFPLQHGWSMDAIWAARLGLGEEAWDMMWQHARRYNRFRYGGWDSNDNSDFPDGLSVNPFTDAAGLSAFALNESLLQSHGGVIRIAPAVTEGLSGIFQLRAEGGFLVAAEFEDRSPRFARIQSLQGKTCTLSNPWPGECIVREGRKELQRSPRRTIRFKTRRGGVYLIEQASRPLSQYAPVPLRDQPNQKAGLPGRD